MYWVATTLLHLRALNLLKCTSITDTSMTTLANHCRSLNVLHMGGNPHITRKGIDVVRVSCAHLHDFRYSHICYSEQEFSTVVKADKTTALTVLFYFDEAFIRKRARATHTIDTLFLQYHRAVGVITRPGLNRLCEKWPRLRTLIVHEKDRIAR